MPGRTPIEEAASLPPSAYVVLGLLARHGPLTPYDMKARVADAIGYFWDFPHSQLYVEPPRLARLGLLEETRETSGRRRRRFSLTDTGRQVLQDWIRQRPTPSTEVRDHGLLRLYFADVVTTADVTRLAEHQLHAHTAMLTRYQHAARDLAPRTDAQHQQAVLRMGLAFEQAAVTFWRDIRDTPTPPDGSESPVTRPITHCIHQ